MSRYGTIVAAVAVTGAAAALPLFLAASIIENGVMASGLPAVLSAAEPPLGLTARIALAVVAAVVTAGVLAVAILLAKRHRTRTAPDVPTLRRADAHPDAPARRPIMAHADLGAPLPMVADEPVVEKARPLPADVERALPADLSQPLAAFDPAAVPDEPLTPPRPVKSLATRSAIIDPGERFETFALTPPPPSATDRTPASSEPIATLLDRLERGAARRQQQNTTLEETLGTLRQLAAR